MSLDPNPKPLQETAHSGCAGGCSAAVTTTVEIPAAADLAQSDGVPVFVIPTMDCPNEENDIRRAVAGIEGAHVLQRVRDAIAALPDGPAITLQFSDIEGQSMARSLEIVEERRGRPLPPTFEAQVRAEMARRFETELQMNDTLVLSGTAQTLAVAEEKLLRG